MLFADVIVDVSVKNLDRPFQYRVPEEMGQDAVAGAQVLIPFGKGNRLIKGFIIGLSEEPDYDIEKIKSIERVIRQGVVVESHLLSLAFWMKENYGSTMNDCIKTVMPVKQEIRGKIEKWIYPAQDKEELQRFRIISQQKHHVAKVRVIDGLLEEDHVFGDGISYADAVHKWGAGLSVLKGLEEKGILKITETKSYRNPLAEHTLLLDQGKNLLLNEEQQKIVDAFSADYRSGIRKPYLIHGVTGSGKTEVYMRLIRQVLLEEKQVIVLIPEIALTFQTVRRFYERFGDQVSLMHSRLSAGERYDQFLRAKRGEIKIMIGPRSALFTPFSNLGLIIIDEEHEPGYQSEHPPKYHVRETSLKRAEMVDASVVFGSATPSLEVYQMCRKGRCTLFTMKKRAADAQMPEVHVVDLREEFAAKNYSVFSRVLQEKMEERLQKKEQIMLFLNRRGYAGFVSCRKCGEVIECENCSVSMKAHERHGKVTRLKCHYCGAEREMPQICPKCGSRYIGIFGIGTQQVEEMLRKRFPSAGVLRMDADTTSGKEGHKKILKAFMEQQADILIGTQMIVKGHDFPNVTLVGVLAADLSLNGGDFRSAERTYQLLSQAAGRAGRGRKRGEVIFQTYQPEHYSIVSAAKGDYGNFFRQEIAMRQVLQYPPISNILEVLVFSELKEHAEQLSELLRQQIGQEKDLKVLGPADAAIAKLKNTFRRVLYVKSADYSRLCRIKDRLERFLKENTAYHDCRLVFTFN